jgi:hypothetical protein
MGQNDLFDSQHIHNNPLIELAKISSLNCFSGKKSKLQAKNFTRNIGVLAEVSKKRSIKL